MSPAVWKDDPVTVKYEARARNLIKWELQCLEAINGTELKL